MHRFTFSFILGQDGKIDKLRGKLPISIIKEGEKHIACCPILNLTTYGDSAKKAKKRFEEALIIFFQELIEMGTLEEVLKENGWEEKENSTPDVPTWTPPQIHNELLDVSAMSCQT